MTTPPDTSGRASPFAALDPCVHCGFCLPACPTYLATGDEADSPRGRIVLMRALERGELPPADPAVVHHLDACLGCRGCEPACPSGVGYGRGLEAARELLAAANGLGMRAQLVLQMFRRRALWRTVFGAAGVLRRTGLARRLAGSGTGGFAFGMLAATAPALEVAVDARGSADGPASRGTVALFRGCVMDTLFRHVHEATRHTLTANGYRVVEVAGQECCGALHAHAGATAAARALAARNVAALAERADFIVVNSAGCGALLKDYGHLLGTKRAEAMAARVRDVSELLADAGPRSGGAMPLDVAYDAPCHLLYAQGVRAAPLVVLGAIPELRVRLLPGSEQCCGSAGIYSMLHPAMARRVLDAKIAELAGAVPRPALVITGNPGCLMQIGAGLLAAGLPIGVAHPVELLDRSYRIGGVYDAPPREIAAAHPS